MAIDTLVPLLTTPCPAISAWDLTYRYGDTLAAVGILFFA